ncbi:MAG: beta-1,6-N-acetylglucosaminyltransferase [Bacteroidales bacterium]|nr:beta-1,6-N-acetylglucosaminyltransferase [Bacteroidales bacterium]
MADRHAYLIQAHGNFEQLQKLLDALDDSRNDIYVHIDAKSDFRGGLSCRHANLYLTPRISVNWGGPSQIWSELVLLKEATRTHHSYYHLLSGSDLPIKSQDYIHDFFLKNEGKEFVEMTPVRKSTLWRFQYTLFPERCNIPFCVLLNNIFKFVPMSLGFRRNKNVIFGCGPNWFSITDSLSRLVVSREDWIRKVFSHTNNCDEVFLQTIIRECGLESTVAGTNMRYTDWSRSNHHRHPCTFHAEDYDALMSRPELFARKFDTGVDAEIVELILKGIEQA